MTNYRSRVPQFDPYIQQLPVEAIVQVGMEKQKRYDEGVQKIQQSIDKIAGLDVANDADKAYLQSKLNQLGNDLTFVAAGDFSNYQLVNSVDGMAKQIAYDPNIQTAVSSAAKRRKEFEYMEEARKKGELNPSNEYVFKMQDASWVNNPELGQSYNAKYDSFFDVNKLVKETFSGLEKDGYSYDQVFQTDKNGNVIFKNGVPILSSTMTRLKKEGIFPEKLKATINQIISDPRVNKQLGIDGIYNYRGLDSNSLQERIVSQRDNELSAYREKLFELSIDKSLGKDVQKEIDLITDKFKQVNENYNSLITTAQENPDYVKGSLYKDEVKTRWEKMYGSIKQSEEKLANPAWEADFKVNNEIQRRREFEMEFGFKKEQAAIDNYYKAENLKLNKLKALAEANKDKPKKPGEFDFSTATQLPMNTEKANAIVSVIGDKKFDEASNNWTQAREEVIWKMLFNNTKNNSGVKNIIDESLSRGIEMTEQKARSIMINNAAKKVKMTPEEFRTYYYNKSISEFNKQKTSKNGTDPLTVDLFKNASYAYKNYKEARNNKEAIDKVGERAVKNLGLDKELASIKPETVTYRGVKYNLTAQDQIDIATVHAYSASFYGLGSSDSENEAYKNAENRLMAKGLGDLAERLRDQLRARNLSSPVTGAVASVKELFSMTGDVFKGGGIQNDITNKLNKLAVKIHDKSYDKVASAKAAKIKQLYNIKPDVSLVLSTGDVEQERALGARLASYANSLQKDGDMQQRMVSKDDFENFIDNAGKDGIKYVVESEVDSNGVPLFTVVAMDGMKPVGKMALNPDQARAEGLNPDSLYESQSITALKERLKNNAFQTSTLDPKEISTYTEYNDYYYDDNSGDFPNINSKKYTVKANIIESNGLYYPYVFISDGNTPKVYPFGPSDNLEVLDAKIRAIDNNIAQSVLYQKK